MTTRERAALDDAFAHIEQGFAQLRAALAHIPTADPSAPARLLPVSEAARQLGVGRSTVYELINAGDLRAIKVGRRRLIPSTAITEYIDARQDGTA